MKETAAQLYKADLRFESKDESFTRWSVFNFEHHYHDSRQPYGNLIALNEETLGPKNQVFRHVESDTDIVIIPLAGAIRYTDSLGNDDIVQTGHIRIFTAKDGLSYTLENPYGEDLINYLQIWLKPDSAGETDSQQQKFGFPGKNKLFPIFSGNGENVLKVRSNALAHMGIFETRKEGVYHSINDRNGLFVFVLNGAFEFENRLLEKHDALAIGGISKAAFEALSQNALLLILEIPL